MFNSQQSQKANRSPTPTESRSQKDNRSQKPEANRGQQKPEKLKKMKEKTHTHTPSLYKAYMPNFENPIHDWNPHMPRCIDSQKWKPSTTEPLKYHSLMTLPYISFPGCSTTSLECSLPWNDKHWTYYTDFRFAWTQQNMIIWYTYCLDHMNALFVKFSRFMLPTLVYKIWPPGLVGGLLSKFLPSQLPIHGDVARHGSCPTNNFNSAHAPCVKS